MILYHYLHIQHRAPNVELTRHITAVIRAALWPTESNRCYMLGFSDWLGAATLFTSCSICKIQIAISSSFYQCFLLSALSIAIIVLSSIIINTIHHYQKLYGFAIPYTIKPKITSP